MANSTSTSAASIIEKRVSTLLTETLIMESVVYRAVRDFSAQIGQGMDRLDIPLFNALAPQAVSETAAVTPQTISPVVAQLPLNRHFSIPFFVSDRLSVQGKVNVVTEAINNGAKSLAEEIDNHVISLISANASAAAPDHIIQFTADALADLANAKKLLDLQNVPKSDRFVIASPGFIQKLLGNNNVINADKYGSTSPVQAGFVTRIYGFTLLESSSSQVPADGFLAYHMGACAFGRQIQPSLKSEYKVLEHGFAYSLSHLYGAIATDVTGVRVVKYNSTGA
jgi:hypothetical protein